jgi:peptidoglycan-associated lipoprotein
MRQLNDRTARVTVTALAVSLSLIVGACKKNVPPVAKPAPPPPGASRTSTAPPAPPEPVSEPTVVPPMPVPEDAIGSKSLDDLNRDSPLTPAFFELDSSDLSSAAQAALQQNAGVLKKYGSWQITIEGHADERGSAEYNLALGERRALAARDYLVSLGIPATRVRTVSYGKEFPFDPARTEEAYAKNRRAHFVITAK